MQLRIELVASENDEPVRSETVQHDYHRFRSIFDEAGVKISQRSMVYDSAVGLGHPIGEFVIEFTATVMPVLVAGVSGWFYSRKGRKVRMKVNGNMLEANSIEEMEKLGGLYKAMRSGEAFDLDSHRNGPDTPVGR